jgi:hypothetical protein
MLNPTSLTSELSLKIVIIVSTSAPLLYLKPHLKVQPITVMNC